MRILLVEDEKDIASALATALEHEAYAVDLAVDGVEIELSPKEFAMLEHFITRLDQVVTRTKLIEHDELS